MNKNNWKMKCTCAGNSSWEIGDILEVNNNQGKHGTCIVEGDFSSFETWCKQRAILGSKWELIKEDFTKSNLQECDVVIMRNKLRYVFFDGVIVHTNVWSEYLNEYNEDLTKHDNEKRLDIMQVYRNGILIFDRVEKSPIQIEIESIEEEQRKLADRLSELRKGL